MKNLVFVLIVFSGILVFDFAIADEIHKHDGTILVGKIIEVIPNESYKIQLISDSIFVVKFDEVNKVIFSEKETHTNSRLRKHHIGIQSGIFNPPSDVIELGGANLVPGNASFGVLNYRYSLNPFIDLVLDFRSWSGKWVGSGIHLELTNVFVGSGIRLNGNRTKGKRITPYLQGNIYFVQERIKAFRTLTANGIGFGLSSGIDIKVSHLISIPVEATYLKTVSDDMDDLSGFGLSAGVNFNF